MYPAGVPGVTVRSLALGDGMRLRVAECGTASGSPVLLVHGWGACLYTYRYALPALASTGRRAIAFDLRGHGLSDKPRGGGRYTTAALSADILALLDSLEIGRVDLIGHSLGGRVALEVALTAPDRVARLVLAASVGLAHVRLQGTAHVLTPRITDRFARYLTPRWLTSFLLRGAYGDPTRVPNEVIDEYWAPSQFPNYYRALRALLAEFAWQPMSTEQLGRITQPTLVMLGTADRLIPEGERGTASLPNARIFWLKAAGHLAIEECPSESNEAVIRFLNGDEVIAASGTMS
jgi:pimeloyl-ACP methyl ester carboxylesterase